MGFGLKRLIAVPIRFSAGKLECGAHVTRYTMYERLKAVLPPAHKRGGDVLSISHSGNLVDLLGLGPSKITEANYPEYSATDLRAFPSEGFDYVLSDQVLEHVEGSPQAVFDETRRLLRPGGIAVHTTCLINPVHGVPSDYWRFTVDGLRYLARDFSEIVAAEGFGNRAIWVAEMFGLRFTPVPHATWHPLHKVATMNNPEWPVSTWIVARK